MGCATADITMSGDALMGIISTHSSGIAFKSRARVRLTSSGITDDSLEFGTSLGVSDAAGAGKGTSGSVFIAGTFGKVSMGNVDSAANAAVGQVSGVGLISDKDQNDITYIANGGGGFRPASFGNTSDPSILYRYSIGRLALWASATQPSDAGQVAYSLAARYSSGANTFAFGYEREIAASADIKHLIAGATTTFDDLTLKAVYGKIITSSRSPGIDQWAVSVAYKADALTISAFYADDRDVGIEQSNAVAYGIGASYIIGGGASLVGGFAHNETAGDDVYDFGVSMSF
jgi:outer membrane protein OmpU